MSAGQHRRKRHVRFKRASRSALLQKRDRIKLIHKKAKESAIRKRLYASESFRKARHILFYASFRSEVDTIQCMRYALRKGKKIALPRVEPKARKLRLYAVKDVSDLISGYMGILEPDGKKSGKTDLGDIDLVIIPGAGFDVTGNRLGYGHGYYDRLLAHKSYNSRGIKRFDTIALAFEEQIIPRVPNESHDIRIDRIITERRTIRCHHTH